MISQKEALQALGFSRQWLHYLNEKGKAPVPEYKKYGMCWYNPDRLDKWAKENGYEFRFGEVEMN